MLLLACVPASKAPRLPPPVTATSGVRAAVLSFDELSWKPGLAELRWNVGSQGQRSATLWIPDVARPRSLVILLHGAIVGATRRRGGERGSWTRRLLSCLAAPALEALDPLIVAPESADGQWWKPFDTEFVLGLSAAARQRWPEVANRSVIMGYSNGGIATWYFARLYPEYFSAAIPLAFNDSIVGATPLPVFAIQGDKDELFPIAPIRAAIEAQKAQGVDVTLQERYRAGHMQACAYEPELALAALWLEQHAFPKASGAVLERASSPP
jgi:hypothetical protein